MSFLERITLGAIAAVAIAALGASCATSQPASGSAANSTTATAASSAARASSAAAASSSPAASLAPSSSDAASSSGAAASSSGAPSADEVSRAKFAELVDGLSEPDKYFFSDNLISNETSYLQIVEQLPALADPAGVYIGVGPEQNFTYIAAMKPKVAYIVDIRRGNMLIHLLYRAAFEEATSRAHFVSLLLGNAAPAEANKPDAPVADVIAAAEKAESSEATFAAAHDKLSARIKGYGVNLGAEDTKALKDMHKEFFKAKTKIRFELKEQNGRLYPTLAELLGARSPSGKAGGFLATDESFAVVQNMQKAGTIIPIVGDFAGDKALPGLAKHLEEQNLTVSVFYVSNVEQYLLDPKVWAKWTRNVKALPKNDKSLFLRGYLDQGKKHPKQMDGHRTATVLNRIVDFEKNFANKPTATFFALCTDNVVAP